MKLRCGCEHAVEAPDVRVEHHLEVLIAALPWAHLERNDPACPSRRAGSIPAAIFQALKYFEERLQVGDFLTGEADVEAAIVKLDDLIQIVCCAVMKERRTSGQ